MAQRCLIVSDLHLSDVEDHQDGWLQHKSQRYVFDGAFARLVDDFRAAGEPDDELTLILNGDIFDFDLVTSLPEDPPFEISRLERRGGLEATEDKSIWKLQRVLSFHPGFVATLATFLAHGGRLVYVLGNHDRELHFDGVKEVLVAALRASAEERGLPEREWELHFEPWFFLIPGRLYVEHGQQYDYYTSYRYLLKPVVSFGDEERIALPMANISNRLMLSRMGFFNPHAMDFILNGFHYFWHWLSLYAFTRRGLVMSWLCGSLLAVGRLLRTKPKLRRSPPGYHGLLEEARKRYGLTPGQLQALLSLHRKPITSKLYRVMREFWLDRLLIGLVMAGGTVALALVPIPLWIKLMVPLSSFPLAFLLYERLAQGETVFTVEHRLPRCARAIARYLDVRLVVFGHTHVPRHVPLEPDVAFVDCGTWAPIFDRAAPRELAPGYRNYLVVRWEGEQASTLRFDVWPTGGPRKGRRPAPSSPPG